MAIDVRTDPQVDEPAAQPRPAAAAEMPGARAPFVALDELRVGTPVYCADGRCGRIDRVLIDPVTDAPRALVVRTRRLFGARRVVPTLWISAVGDDAVTLWAARADLAGRPEHRTDQRLRADVRSRLMDDDPIRALGLRHASLEVAAGVVTLRGHVPSRLMATRMADIARGTPGVVGVVDDLVADDDLELAVAQAIGREPLNRWSRLKIRADRGHVLVGGVFPSRAAYEEALRVAGGVAGVVAVARWPGTATA
jgi:osmotically-inducible protein OsmY